MQRKFNHFFSTKALIDSFATKRARLALKRTSENYFDRFSSKNSDKTTLDELFPPRSAWINPRPKKTSRGRERMPLKSRILITLKRESYYHWAHDWETTFLYVPFFLRIKNILLMSSLKEKRTKYVRQISRIYEIIKDIQIGVTKRILSTPNIKFNLATKDKSKGTYRLLCEYDLTSEMIFGQLSKYLRMISEDFFLPSSFAFRWPTAESNPSHHKAISLIHEFIETNFRAGHRVFIAECDIAKFFDSIHHDVILECLEDLESHFFWSGKRIPAKVRSILMSFLESYSFTEARKKALCSKGLALEDADQIIPWIMKEPLNRFIKYLNGEELKKVGIPQGSALSCYLANLVLHKADKAVHSALGKHLGRECLYIRYCDDIIILSTDKQLAEKAFGSYLKALEDLKLPYHEPISTGVYDKSFWDIKSKHVYELSNSEIPWVGYVGYQIRYDGLCRIRRSSVKKEKEAQKKLIDTVISRIKKNPKKMIDMTTEEIIHSVKMRIACRVNGKATPHVLKKDYQGTICWMNGFSHLSTIKKNQQILYWHRELDRSKNKSIKRLRRELKKLNGDYSFVSKNLVDKEESQKEKIFHGKPFGYGRHT